MAEAYIVRALRTAGGRRGGRLAPVHPVDLGAAVINALVEGLDFDRALVDDVIWGCVGQAGEQSTNVGRNTVLASVLPQSVPGTSLDRQCGSSQQALHFAAQAVMSGTQDIVIAGGVESMTRVPMGMPVTLPFKNGFGTCKSPGIEAKYPGPEFSQFTGAEMVAAKYGFDRATLDVFALESHRKAVRAVDDNRFADEIVPITVTGAEGGDCRRHRLVIITLEGRNDLVAGLLGIEVLGQIVDPFVVDRSHRVPPLDLGLGLCRQRNKSGKC